MKSICRLRPGLWGVSFVYLFHLFIMALQCRLRPDYRGCLFFSYKAVMGSGGGATADVFMIL